MKRSNSRETVRFAFKAILITAIILTNVAAITFSQSAPPAPPPPPLGNKPPPPSKIATKEDTEAEFAAKIKESAAEKVNWKLHAFPADSFAASFPRTPVVKTEVLSDPSFGKMTLKLYTSIDDGIVFVVGTTTLPYAITDEAIARKFREESSKGALEVKDFEWADQKEVEVEGRKMLEVNGKNREHGGEAVFRSFLVGKTFFYQMAMTVVPENVDAEERGIINRGMREDKDRFFESFKTLQALETPVEFVEPIFRSSFNEGVFTSEFFEFTMRVPAAWHEVGQDDVRGMREYGKGIIASNSKVALPKTSNARKNLFTFSSKPMGAEGNHMLNCTVVKMPMKDVTAFVFSQSLENTLSKFGIYTIINKTRAVRVGANTFASFDMDATVGERKFSQSGFVILKKGYALIFSATYDDETKAIAMDIMKSIRFSER